MLWPQPPNGNARYALRLSGSVRPPPTARAKAIILLLNRQLTPLVGTVLAAERQLGMHGLSPRLRQTLEGLLAGKSDKQIAARLGIGKTTVHDHVASLYRRFGVEARGELMAYFLRRRPAAAPVTS